MFTIEEESGTYVASRPRHPHNGYYAGDFSGAPILSSAELAALTRLRAPSFPAARGE